MFLNLSLFFQFLLFSALSITSSSRNFTISSSGFLLDNVPFQLISGEMHYPRIPRAYWQHRIQMAKAMGVNTIATYIFWNVHQHGINYPFDFETAGLDLLSYIKLIQTEGLFLLIRPGPYVCGEWDLGGLPSWLLSEYDMKFRCSNKRYLIQVENYIKNIANLIRDYQITKGGPIIMLQIENEYGSYGNDRKYLNILQKLWRSNGIEVPFYTADGAWVTSWETALELGSIENSAVGIDPGITESAYEIAHKIHPNSPIFSAETYPGWMTHWGEEYKGKDIETVRIELEFLLSNKKSFNLYVIHGGTNFGFNAGANNDETNGFQPQITSYDYDAPINEQGSPTPKFYLIRDLISKYTGRPKINIPNNISLISFDWQEVKPICSLWDNLQTKKEAALPQPMEYFGQKSGLIVYKTQLNGTWNGTLKIKDLHDYGLIFLDQKFVGTLDRMKNSENKIQIKGKKGSILEILIEGMGRVNFGEFMYDYKGITEYVALNGIILTEWEIYNLPLETKYLKTLKQEINITELNRESGFFKTYIDIKEIGDTYIDLQDWNKGIVWANGNNLGRYWDKGPQNRLFWPGCWMRLGKNEIIILDLHKRNKGKIRGLTHLMN